LPGVLAALLAGILADLLARIVRWHVERLVCIHFCKFKAAGSDLKYVHVHILGSNPGRHTGLGHDDHTGNDEGGHVTVSDAKGDCTISKETGATLALRGGYLGTAYFIEAPDGECPPGFTRIRCKCPTPEGEIDVWVCYTMEHNVWEGWYDGQKYPDRTGNFIQPYAHEQSVTGTSPGTLKCGASFVVFAFALESVPNCDSHSGANAGENSAVQEARRKLRVAVDKIGCESGCTKSHSETFKGWKCETIAPGSFLAQAAVQWTVVCERP
jgi:hypothetical protein